ncbi:MAG TPA: tRNA uridine-5-carboxymethylaminomethyl(34) synthesis GTPase MnmE [Firmicutes bacterium]|nr:tRNA uridine-5-carboxymethylaminomethyl(34) synthesis GTPase MnmE [Bacillota bacterium]
MEPTIAALSTFPGKSAIGIIRISGPGVFDTLKRVFSFSSAPMTLAAARPRFIYRGFIKDEKSAIDEVLLALFKKPSSYTGEDMAEIYCHGNPLLIDKILDLLFQNNVIPAEPGEFTRRAFLNGKMDLSQAEAIAEIISSKNEAAIRINAAQLLGKEKNVISALSGKIKNMLSLIEAEIDFAYEDIQKITHDNIIECINECLSMTDRLIKGADEGIMLKNGIKTVFTGLPNSGKSSLFNALLKKNRAIVTNIPGTTRDTIEGSLTIDGLPFTLIDTAGIRDSSDIIEAEGIKRADEAAVNADILIITIDSSVPYSDSFFLPFRMFSPDKKLIFALNKSDLPLKISVSEIKKILPKGSSIVSTNTVEKNGISDLTNELKNIIINDSFIPIEDITVSSLRHKQALLKAQKSLVNALNACSDRMSFEFPAADIREAIRDIESILGRISSEDILEEIFSNFCIGK